MNMLEASVDHNGLVTVRCYPLWLHLDTSDGKVFVEGVTVPPEAVITTPPMGGEYLREVRVRPDKLTGVLAAAHTVAIAIAAAENLTIPSTDVMCDTCLGTFDIDDDHTIDNCN